MSWKDDFADKATKALDHQLVTNVREEYEFNMGPVCDLSSGLPAYGLAKVMRTVAIVASAYALGIDPDSLRLSRDEANEDITAQARRFAAAGTPILTIDPTTTTPEQAAATIQDWIAEGPR